MKTILFIDVTHNASSSSAMQGSNIAPTARLR
jgi:hypothetical protein